MTVILIVTISLSVTSQENATSDTIQVSVVEITDQPMVRNIRYRIEDDKIIIGYDLIARYIGEGVDIFIRVRIAPGTLYSYIPDIIKGDVGKGVIPGRNKKIIWSYLEEIGNHIDLNDIGFKITSKPGELQYNFENEYDHLTDIDENVYRVITIGGQRWMADNLKVTRYRNGTAIPIVTDNTDWINYNAGARIYYKNNPAYGALYNWHVVGDWRGLCPVGWRVPTYEEWKIFIHNIGGFFLSNKRQISFSNADLTYHNIIERLFNKNDGIKSTGGFRDYFGGFGRKDIHYFWSSTEFSSHGVWAMGLRDNSKFHRGRYSKGFGFSVRCVEE